MIILGIDPGLNVTGFGVIRKEGQKLIISLGQADMGWALPGSIGVAMNTADNVIVFIGDGSFYSNVQELAVAKYNNLPIKFVVGNNNGYMSIRNTQTKFYEQRVYGEGEGRGLFFPSLEKIAKAFDIEYATIKNMEDLNENFEHLIHSPKCTIIEVMLKQQQDVYPALAIKPDGKQGALHEMYPFLTQEEIDAEMITKL
jgi:acetolactate synthase-1/2/3 large subunit